MGKHMTNAMPMYVNAMST